MRNSYFFLFLLAFSPLSSATVDVNNYTPPKDLTNIHVIPLGSSEDASEFIIFIKNEVKAHYHKSHTELIYVLEGEGIFYLDDTKQMIKPGHFIRVDRGQLHSVKVTSFSPLKVLSIQTPEFKGQDRVFVD